LSSDIIRAIKEDEMGGTCSTHMKGEKYTQNVIGNSAEGSIDIDLKEIRYEGAICIQDKDQNTAIIIIRVSLKAEIS
jgi:hypothetical protein